MFVEHKEAGEVTEAPAKIDRLSQAIRIGATKRPQCFGDAFRHGGSCALGAALEATGVRPWSGSENDRYPTHYVQGLIEARFRVPLRVTQQVWKLNDVKGWSREQIADWLESQGY